MEFISFRCSACNQGLKISADKAGRKIKCTKCGTALVIPASSSAQVAAAQSPARQVEQEEPNDKKGYGLMSAPGAAELKPEDEPKKEKDKPPPLTRKLKTLAD